ncbi:hypothetical protein MNBD_GAMMA05-1545 [hydrothermal vent metagenome]|uniref:Uncharacterized protein n=1 Tax=hydrothermal vent metagenome TaxID=652676 RepID=A0A3B0WSU8_9ZZZZ
MAYTLYLADIPSLRYSLLPALIIDRKNRNFRILFKIRITINESEKHEKAVLQQAHGEARVTPLNKLLT